MNTFLEVLELVAVFVAIIAIKGWWMGKQADKAAQEWYTDCTKALDSLLSNARWEKWLRDLAIDINVFKTSSYLIAIVAHNEREIAETRCKFTNTDKMYLEVDTVSKRKIILKNGVCSEEAAMKIGTKIAEKLKPWVEGSKCGDRALFYSLLRAAYSECLGCEDSDPILVETLNILTLGRSTKIGVE